MRQSSLLILCIYLISFSVILPFTYCSCFPFLWKLFCMGLLFFSSQDAMQDESNMLREMPTLMAVMSADSILYSIDRLLSS